MTGEQAQVLVSLAAMAAAAFGGQTPVQVGVVAQDAAERVRRLFDQLEQLGERQARDAVGCARTANCACLYCVARASEPAPASRGKRLKRAGARRRRKP